ncbi:hypothetical protein ACOMD4_27700 [Streptomyces anulatus]|uniref:hypothetical protein n=1 Tax=Streptomyces anulatus TaxID=1892 RepID=UPI003B7733E3
MRTRPGQRGVPVRGARLGGSLHGSGEGEHGVQMGGAVGLPRTAGGVQPLQGVGPRTGVPPGPQFGVGEVFEGLGQQRVGSPGPYGGERAGPRTAGGGDVPEDQGRDPGPEQRGRGAGSPAGSRQRRSRACPSAARPSSTAHMPAR